MDELYLNETCSLECLEKFSMPSKLSSPSKELCEVCSKRCERTKLDVIRRVLHYDDYLQSLKTEKLTAYAMESGQWNKDRACDNTNFAHDDLKVLFFAPESPKEENDFHGNVGFDIEFERVIERFKYFYYIEHFTYKKSVCFHVLVTRKSLEQLQSMFPHVKDIIDYSSSSLLCPVNLEEQNSYTYIHKIQSNDEYPCDVDLIIDCDQENDTEWFYKNCEKIAVNHAEANEPWPRKCRNYRSCPPLWKKKKCPFPDTIEKTERNMASNQMELCKPFFKDITTKMEEWKPVFSELAEDCYEFSKYKPLLGNLDRLFKDFLISLKEVSNVNQDEMECDTSAECRGSETQAFYEWCSMNVEDFIIPN